MSLFSSEYTLDAHPIGSGAFGEVFACSDHLTGSRFAVKIVNKSKLKEKDLEFVQAEIDILRRIDHPNVLRMVKSFTEKEFVYIVTELCAGGELFDRIVQREFYSEADAQGVMKAIASALEYCHVRNIIHRDLKPENILLVNTEDHSPIKIADFGFAKQIADGAEDPREALGTPNYMAPEMLRNLPYTCAVDMWSFGVIVYVLLSGYLPFHADTKTHMFNRILKCDLRFDPPYWDKISELAKDLIRKLLVLNAEERLTVQGVLQHPWMTETLSAEKDVTPALHELRSMQIRRRPQNDDPDVGVHQMKELIRRLDEASFVG